MSFNKKLNISVFFPCYNEEKNLESLTNSILNFLPAISDQYEVIIVNDGSKDRTREIAETLSKKNHHVKVFNHETNLGYGAALKTGFKNAKFDYIFFTDGDNQFDIKEIERFIPFSQEFDVVAGYRINRRDNFIRRLNATSFKMFVRMLFGLQIRDLNCAFKLFKKKVIDAIDIESTGAFINAEILIKAKKKGFTMTEVGVTHYPRQWGTQTGANPKVIFRAFCDLFKLHQKLK
ncbi:MAG: cell wall biosynthesis glycosyltransferase [Candidatus Schekmanbacteria bacterium GWA2_38_11]|uniref:Cell wall biosynthesis glycosyltransferase n=1 Tax=Candidatus Schekmanbacteria bacterium GWA2_38_11 TaxID=1817876 RepID=A0A1F7RMD3_9BACT|nr:MAG: cell wall biosynthesis glycosyltransferase [Candidatus Schekmanbacteria bacterium GWA2_38_11]